MGKLTKVQLQYNALQILHWVTMGLMFSFAAVYLQARGINNSVIGLVLAASFALSAVLQPLVAAIVDRWRLPLSRAVAAMEVLIAVLCFLIYILKLPEWTMCVVLVGAFSLHQATESSVNSLAELLTQLELPVNFGVARGMASFIFAVIMSAMGQVLQQVSPMILPLCYLTTTVLTILVLVSMKPLRGAVLCTTRQKSGFPTLREYPYFWVFLLSIVFLFVGENMTSNFTLQIMQNVGGDSSNVGLAVGFCAAMEVPSMLLYSRFSRRFGVHRLLIMAAWLWIAKIAILYLAASTTMVMASYILQFFTYAIYIPGCIEFVGRVMPREIFLKSQSLASSSCTVGCVAANLSGGVLIDALGVHQTLGLMVCSMVVGAVLMTIGVRGSMRKLHA